MSSQSTQTSRPALVRNPCNSRTNAPSQREYEMKTSAKVRQPCFVVRGDVSRFHNPTAAPQLAFSFACAAFYIPIAR
jgi:hypothetical protein